MERGKEGEGGRKGGREGGREGGRGGEREGGVEKGEENIHNTPSGPQLSSVKTYFEFKEEGFSPWHDERDKKYLESPHRQIA